MIVNCDQCNKEIYKRPSHVEKYSSLYCSRKCASLGNVVNIPIDCAGCGKSMLRKPHEIAASKTGRLFCSHKCSAIVSNMDRGGKGVTQYRLKAFKMLEHKCDCCGYNTVPEVLQVHHIDRDHSNIDITNLQILCPTCHHEEHFQRKDGMYHSYKDGT